MQRRIGLAKAQPETVEFCRGSIWWGSCRRLSANVGKCRKDTVISMRYYALAVFRPSSGHSPSRWWVCKERGASSCKGRPWGGDRCPDAVRKAEACPPVPDPASNVAADLWTRVIRSRGPKRRGGSSRHGQLTAAGTNLGKVRGWSSYAVAPGLTNRHMGNRLHGIAALQVNRQAVARCSARRTQRKSRLRNGQFFARRNRVAIGSKPFRSPSQHR